jgi:hypothetical protein
MSSIAEPQPQPQNNPDPRGPSIPGQAPAPEGQTRNSLAATLAPAPTPASLSTEMPLEHDDDRFPSHATAVHGRQQQLQHSEHSLHRLHHHVDGSILAASTSAPQSQNQNHLEAANIAHFDALGHDFDKQNPFSAEFADRLSRALRRLFSRRSAGSSSSSNNNNVGSDSLVLDEEATSVLDYAC